MAFFTGGRNGDGYTVIRWGRIVISAIIFIFAIIILLAMFRVVPSGHTGVVTTFGAVSDRVLPEGLHMVTPFVTNVIAVDNRVLRVDVDASSASRDLQTISSTISLNYRVDRESSASVYKNVGRDFENKIVHPAVQECIKAVTARYTAEELITKRQDVGDQMRALIAEKIEVYGLKTEIFNIINFDFSEEFNMAIEAKQTAQQAALKAEQDLARIRVEAEQKIAEAQAEAEAYRVKSQEITEEMIRMEAIKRWDGKLPAYYAGEQGNIFNIPIN